MYNNFVSIQDLSNKFKGLLLNTEVLLSVLIVAVACISFYLGTLSVKGNIGFEPHIEQYAQAIGSNLETAPKIETATSTDTTITAEDSQIKKGEYVASKSGAKYHLPWCPGAKQIKEENKVWFTSKEEAEKAGYTPAANCKGI